jgi:acyl-CoA thioester hydrolase
MPSSWMRSVPPPTDRTGFAQHVTAVAADIDALGHVNNAVYVRWIQAVATAHWQAVAPPADVARYVWVVTRHEIDYLRATIEGETLTLTTWVGTPRGARFDRCVEITDAAGRVRVRALTVWALIDQSTGRAVRVPPAVAAPFLR